MFENRFSHDEAALTPADLDHLEFAIGKKLPTSFRNHYLKYNGGMPARGYWVGEDDFEPIEVAAFKPIPLATPRCSPPISSCSRTRCCQPTCCPSPTTGVVISFA
ncbi:SMI1/KNR4 family protein [Pseudomonas sp. SMN5]|uniref:SMI1/KNR4 family protein n=1 Tax=Pseudomonas sp. SMN5 TaxID=3390198 RepID=UPI003F860C3E